MKTARNTQYLLHLHIEVQLLHHSFQLYPPLPHLLSFGRVAVDPRFFVLGTPITNQWMCVLVMGIGTASITL